MLQSPTCFQVPIRVFSSAASAINLNENELESLLLGSGLQTTDLYPGSQKTISGELFFELSKKLLLLRDSPTTNLELGANTQLSVMWPLNEYFLSAPDLYSAMSAPPEFQPLRLPFLRNKLSLEDAFLKIELEVFVDIDAQWSKRLTEVYFQVIQNLAQSYIGHPIQHCHFEFNYHEPTYSSAYSEFFNGSYSFSNTSNSYFIPIEFARKSGAKANKETYQLAREICQQQLNQVSNNVLSMADRVCRTILSQPMGRMHEEAVANALFVSKRTLARRLSDEGRSFRQIREDLLAQLASRQLRESNASVESIAILLGYSDTANFRRAFKRWFSKSPSDYRHAFKI